MANIKTTIRFATEADCDAIVDFMSKHYYPEDPLILAHTTAGLPTKEEQQFTIGSQLKHGTCVVAFEEGSGKMVGVAIAGPIDRDSVKKMLEEAESASAKWKDIALLMAYVDKKSDLFNRYKIDKALHGHAAAVHPDCCDKQISSSMFEFLCVNAKKLNYPLLSFDCASVHEIKNAEQCGMELVSTVTYDEYNASIGRQQFKPITPDVEIKTFVKDLRK